ncbi:MAG: HEAT repeat domain-containing protein [Tepidisphaerales bacterium]
MDLAPTLGRIVRESSQIALVEVDRFSRESGVVVLKKIRDLKGQTTNDRFRHQVSAAPGAAVSRSILEWAEPGRRAVLFCTQRGFFSQPTLLVCLGNTWYQAAPAQDGWWRLTLERPELPLAYCGTVSRLTDAIELILAGKQAVITTTPHGADSEGASFDIALNRTTLPGLVRVQRVRASARMPDNALGVGDNPAYVVGPGAAGDDEIPALIEKLNSPDPTVRAESAGVLRTLGAKAVAAVGRLTQLLGDAQAPVRMSAAAALLRITTNASRPLMVLGEGLHHADALVRRAAARAAGMAGPAAGALTAQLAVLLEDPDELVRVAALQAITSLGADAAAAFDGVRQLLDEPARDCDAADALGRMGPAARPALKRLAKMLADKDTARQWAAVRAMSQIGGSDAAPAVDYMLKALPNCSERDGYNMMIYLALLGPVARPAVPALEKLGSKNPAIRLFALWTIEPERRVPWQSNELFLIILREHNFQRYLFEAFLCELGDRARPAARTLARKLVAGSAGQAPSWGYRIFLHFPADSIEVFCEGLQDPDAATRERALTALGHMGAAAAPARGPVEALYCAADAQEATLLNWCLKQLDGPATAAPR